MIKFYLLLLTITCISSKNCKNPKGDVGDSIYEKGKPCQKLVCTAFGGGRKRAAWISFPNLEKCCVHEGGLYQDGSLIKSQSNNSNSCAKVWLSCRKNNDTMPSIVFDINPENCCNAGLMDYIKGTLTNMENLVQNNSQKLDDLRVCNNCNHPESEKVILITGGSYLKNDTTTIIDSAEIYNPATRVSCSLPPLPEIRMLHLQEGGLVCGGMGSNFNRFDDCIEWNPASGTWIKKYQFREDRYASVSWATPSGVWLIGGSGYSSRVSSELVGSLFDFDLKYVTRFACAIPDPDNNEVIITGGFNTRNLVSVYSQAGWQRDLPPMIIGRRWHACGSFKDGVKKVLLVIGGWDPIESKTLESTEMYRDNVWRTVAGTLPVTTEYVRRVATIKNGVLLFGGIYGNSSDDILEFNKDTEEWTNYGKMIVPRHRPGVSVVSFADYEQWCN